MKTDIYQKVTDQIVELMETHGTDWTRPWTADSYNGVNRNVITKQPYRGVNFIMLGMSGYSTPIWGTFKQWKTKGCHVRKGEKGTLGVFWKQIEVKDKDDDTKTKNVPMLRSFYLFNAEQVEGYSFEPSKPLPELERNQQADRFILETGAEIGHGGDRAFYRPSDDRIQMPIMQSFKEPEGYYSTMLHELSHWTGHSSRLNRKFGTKFGNKTYAAEELVAEISSAFLCVGLQITAEPRPDHAKYLNGWLQVLKKDKRAFFIAVSKAQAAADYLYSLQPQTETITEAA